MRKTTVCLHQRHLKKFAEKLVAFKNLFTAMPFSINDVTSRRQNGHN